MSAIEVWRERLEFLETELAIASDAAQKFKIQKDIQEAKKKIVELGGTLATTPQNSSSLETDKLVEGGRMEWFDELPLKYHESGARTALRLIKRAYVDSNSLNQTAVLAGIDVGRINFNQAASYLPMEVLDQAAKQGRTVHFIAEVLMDNASTAIHDDMWKNLGNSAARVHEAALSTRADFDRVSALPSPSETKVNGSAGDFQKIVNALAHFSDSAMFRFDLAQREARIARIDVSGKGQGTGWLVAPDLLMTAYHVIEKSVDELNNVTARFDYKVIPHLDGKLLSNGREIKLATENPLVAHSVHAGVETELSEGGASDIGQLDFALLRLGEKIGDQGLGPDGQGDEPRGAYKLPTDTHTFQPDEGLFVLGHPQLASDIEAGPLKLTLALPSEAMLSQHKIRIRYSVNTEGGNSGSPVMDQSLMPLALHHAGSKSTPSWDANQRWDGGFNQGIPLNLIVDAIRHQLSGSPVLEELGI